MKAFIESNKDVIWTVLLMAAAVIAWAVQWGAFALAWAGGGW